MCPSADGSPWREINTDGTDRLMSYQGCGCAGGEVVTMQSEVVPRDDQPLVNARRTQKVYADVLGRNYKTEVLNWDGAVYASTLQTFNGRDQATKITQQDNTQTPVVEQFTTATFDGFGRVKTRHLPQQQNANGTAAFTTYNYNADDSVSSMMDARGAITNYVYNDARGLLTNVNYTVPSGSNIPLANLVTNRFWTVSFPR